MNLLHVRYALEVAKQGSMAKAADTLFVALPNISRSIKELEADLGIVIFDRTAKGMSLTLEGEEFIGYAKELISHIDSVEAQYKSGAKKKQRFSISVPRATYIAEAFTAFSSVLDGEPCELFYKETNSQRAINNILEHDYHLGIIRYAESFDRQFKDMLEEHGLEYEMIAEFSYLLLMSKDSPLSEKESISFSDLPGLIEIAHADPYVPSLPLSKVVKEELPDNIDERIFIFERASQFDLLSLNPRTFMWVSPVPARLLDMYGLIQRPCVDNTRLYKDVLVYKKGYKLSALDKAFITELCNSRRRNLS